MDPVDGPVSLAHVDVGSRMLLKIRGFVLIRLIHYTPRELDLQDSTSIDVHPVVKCVNFDGLVKLDYNMDKHYAPPHVQKHLSKLSIAL